MDFLKSLGESGVEAADALFDVLATVALYVTIAVIVAVVAYLLVARKKGDEAAVKSRKIALGVLVGYSVGIIAALGSLKLVAKQLDGKLGTNFWLMVILAVAVLAWVCLAICLSKSQVPYGKWIILAVGVLVLAYVVVILCVIPAKKDYYEPLDKTLMYVLSAVLFALIVALALRFDKTSFYDSRSLTYAAVCIATSFALSYVKFFTVGAQGGSVTFASLLPLALYSYMFGLRKGVIAGIVYGLLQFVQSPQFYEPMQVMLDYPIAFGAIGLAGIGRKMKFLKGKIIVEFSVGMTIAVVFRYAAHVLSGYFVFSSWAWEGYTPLAYSMAYNSFVFVDLAVALVAAAVLLSSGQVRRMINSVASEQN